MTNPDLERYAELWKGHNGYEEFDLEENEEQEYQSKKAKLEQDLEKSKKYDKIECKYIRGELIINLQQEIKELKEINMELSDNMIMIRHNALKLKKLVKESIEKRPSKCSKDENISKLILQSLLEQSQNTKKEEGESI